MLDFNNILILVFLFVEMIILLRLLSCYFGENNFTKYILIAVLMYRYFTFNQWIHTYIAMFLCVLLCSMVAEQSLGYRELLISTGYPVINVVMLVLFMLINNNISENYFVKLFAATIIIVAEIIISDVFFSISLGKRTKQSKTELKSAVQHDFNNHLSMIAVLAKQNRNEELVSYVERISDNHYFESSLITGNEKLDALLGKKFLDAQKYGIRIENDILVPSDLELDIFDMTVLLGNAFDNAIHAVREISDQEKRIYFKMKYNCNRLLIEMRNGYLVSGSGGIGMKNMEAVVKKYNGLMNFKYLSKEAVLTFILYLQ